MMTRAEYVAICETCLKRKNNLKKGLLCSLTNEYANFNTVCPDYAQDAVIIQQQKDAASGGQAKVPVFETENNLFKSGIWGGVAMLVGGVAWIVIGLAVDRIFFYPIFLIIAGIVVVVRESAKKAKQLNRPDTSGILDDKNDLEIT